MRTSESPMVTSVSTSASARSSRAATVGALSRIDHHTSVGLPGTSVASTLVRPFAAVRRVIRPADRWTSACSPGTSMVARAVPASGTGSANDARPGLNSSGAPHSRSSANAPGPGHQRELAGAFGQERHRPSGRGGGDERRARQQAHAIDAVAKRLSAHAEGSARRVAVHADLQIGGGQHRRPAAAPAAAARAPRGR